MISSGQETRETQAVRHRVAAAHMTAWVVVLGIAVSIAIFTAIGVVLVTSGSRPESPDNVRSLYVMALFSALGSIAMRRTQLRWLKLQAVAGVRGVEGLIKHLTTVTIISAALAEVVGIFAIVSGFVGGSQRDVLTFGIIGLLIALFSYPRKGAWERTVYYFASQSGTGSPN